MSTGAATQASSQSHASEAINSPLGKLFEHQLKDTYFAEKAITKALPKMIKAASAGELKQAFEKHLTQTEEHVKRLETVFQMIGRPAEGTACEAIKGIIKEADEVAAEFGKTGAADAALIASAQAVEHYEIARYGTLKAWANELKLENVVGVIEETEDEEVDTDQLLTELSATLNASAVGARAD